MPDRPGLRQALTAFHYRNFTLFWSGAVLSNTGSWVQSVTVPYVIYQVTGSAAWLGFATFMQFLPIVITGPIGGALADRYHRRSILLFTQSAQALAALALWAVWVSGHATTAAIVGLVALSSVFAGLNLPSWQAFVSELVPREVLLNAVTLNSTQFNAARAFGPALGGLILGAFGPGPAFMINALSFLAVIGALALIRVPRLAKPPASERRGVYREFGDAMRYARRVPGILACLLVVLALGALGSPIFQLLVVFAKKVFLVGGVAYGMLAASMGIGAVLAAPIIAGPGSGLRRSRLVGIALTVYGGCLVAFALAPGYAVAVVALLFAGGGYLAISSTLNTTIQLQVDESMRGKVLALYVMFLTLAVPVGALVQGWLAEVFGPRVTVAGAGLAFLGVSAWIGLRRRLLRHLDDARPVALDASG